MSECYCGILYWQAIDMGDRFITFPVVFHKCHGKLDTQKNTEYTCDQILVFHNLPKKTFWRRVYPEIPKCLLFLISNDKNKFFVQLDWTFVRSKPFFLGLTNDLLIDKNYLQAWRRVSKGRFDWFQNIHIFFLYNSSPGPCLLAVFDMAVQHSSGFPWHCDDFWWSECFQFFNLGSGAVRENSWN